MNRLHLALTVLFLCIPLTLKAVPKKIIIIRHAEKLDQKNPGPYLSDCGIQRSLALPSFFLELTDKPAALFAQPSSDDSSSLRCIQTLAPTAAFYANRYPDTADNFTLQTNFKANEVKELATYILSNPIYNDEKVIICWSHEYLQKLADELGVKNPPKWHGNDYTGVWTISYHKNTEKVKSFKQKVQPFNLHCKN